MKKLILTLLLALSIALGADARTFVLIAGVSNYGDENVNLSQTTKDAKRFKEVMQSQTRDITTLTSSYATRSNIKEKLRAICNRAGANDRVIFFFSGHGMPNALYTYDGALPYSELVDILSSSSAKEKICFIDACHAGSLAEDATANSQNNRGWSNRAMRAPGQAFFVSSRPEEYSLENGWIGAGFFTQALVKGLRGAADKDHNREVTVKELFNYIYKDIVRRSGDQQHPQLIAPREMYPVVVASW